MDVIILNLIFVVYLILWHIHNRIRNVYRVLVGLHQIQHGQIRVSRIVFRHKREDEEISRPEDFVTIHESFEPDEILKDEHWYLYVLDKNTANFVLLPKPISHYNIINYPFIFVPIFSQALKVAEMPIDDFISWSKEIEEDQKIPNTVLFTNTARCASTLFGSMLQHEGKSIVLGEPHVLSQLSAGQSEGLWHEDDLKKLVPASIRALRKNIPSDQLFVIKTASYEIRLLPYAKLLSNMKFIFMFRKNAVDSVEKATYRAMGRFSYQLLDVYLFLYKLSPPWFNGFMGLLYFSEGWMWRKLDPRGIKEWSFCTWFAPIVSYLKYQDHFCYPIVWHHELIHNTEEVLKGVFKAISEPGQAGLTDEDIPRALERLKVDSQGGTFLSQANLKSVPLTPYTDETKKRLKKFVADLNVPEEYAGFDF